MCRINVLHLITELEPGGAENLLVATVKEMAQRDYNVMVGYIYGPGTLASQLKSFGAEVVDLSLKGKIDPLVIIKLFFLIKKKRIDIVHTHLVHASIVGRISSRLAGVKAIISTRHYGYNPKEKSFMHWLERKTSYLNKKIIAISQAVREYMIKQQNYDSEKLVVFYNAVDLSDFNPQYQRKATEDNNGYMIGSVGHLHPQKGHDVLIKAFALVAKECPRAKLVIAGDGDLRTYLQKLVSQLRMEGNVAFLGVQEHSQVINILGYIELFVLASNWEGFGIAIIEAMAMAKPVIATKVEGIKEVVDDGYTGLLVPPNQPEVLAEKILYLMKKPELAKIMGERGRRKVEKEFSTEVMIEKLERLYQSVSS